MRAEAEVIKLVSHNGKKAFHQGWNLLENPFPYEPYRARRWTQEWNDACDEAWQNWLASEP